VPNNYFNISGILGRVTVIFWKISAFFINNLKTFRHCYRNTIIIMSFIYCIYQCLRANFKSYLTKVVPEVKCPLDADALDVWGSHGRPPSAIRHAIRLEYLTDQRAEWLCAESLSGPCGQSADSMANGHCGRASRRRLLDMIFPKNVQSDNPVLNTLIAFRLSHSMFSVFEVREWLARW
jgi:hypothetical protein